MNDRGIRLQVYLARSGVASRRKAEELIKAGLVQVDGQIKTELGYRLLPGHGTVEVDGVPIADEPKRYILLNKPAGYICSVSDGFGRSTVLDLLSTVTERVFPVGRLDQDTEGLLILSNDGDFCHLLTHPRHRVSKRYRVRLRNGLTSRQIADLSSGVDIGDSRPTVPARIKVLGSQELEIIIREGRKRQVRRMIEAVGNRVEYLERTAIGTLRDSHLPRGSWRELTSTEVEALILLARADGKAVSRPETAKTERID